MINLRLLLNRLCGHLVNVRVYAIALLSTFTKCLYLIVIIPVLSVEISLIVATLQYPVSPMYYLEFGMMGSGKYDPVDQVVDPGTSQTQFAQPPTICESVCQLHIFKFSEWNSSSTVSATPTPFPPLQPSG